MVRDDRGQVAKLVLREKVAMAIVTSKSVFYHINKCGGNYVKEALSRSVRGYTRKGRDNDVPHELDFKKGHVTPAGIRDVDKDGRFSFTFVRHPVAWYRSFWCYRVRKGKLDKKFPLDRAWDDNYEKFIINMLAKFPDGFASRVYRCYVGDDLSLVDFIGRTESLEDDLVTALTLAGEDFDEGVLRKTEPRNRSARGTLDRAVISKDLENEIIKADKWTIDNFYTKG